MSLSRKKWHTIKTLRVYPRIHYFQRRFHDLIPRFKRLIDAFPKSFHVDKLIDEIDKIDDKFTKALDICVIGDSDLDLANILVSTKPCKEELLSELKDPSRISLYICYIKMTQLSGLESITAVIDTFYDEFAKEAKRAFEDMFVVIDIEQSPIEEEQNSFRTEVYKIIQTKLQGTDIEITEGRVIFGSSGTVLGSKISEHLETMIVSGFHKVMIYLERFVKKTKQFQVKDVEILHTDLVVESIQAFLRDDIGLADMRKIAKSDESKETEGLGTDEKFLLELLKKLARLVKCSIVEPLPVKYNIPSWIVNLLLEEIEFEWKAVDSVSKNTRHHLRKLNDFSKDFEEILKTLKRKANMGKGKIGASRHDMSKVISDVEKTMDSAEQIITVMGKMMFEIEGYLVQTITEEYEPKSVVPDIPQELRKAVLELRDVYGVGRVYDYIEIHVKKDMGTYTEDIPQLMHKYEFSRPYQIKTVTKTPEKLMANIHHENGKLIKSPFPDNRAKYREGTLGCFAENGTKKLYFLTCAHVVPNPNKEEHDVLIPDRDLKMRKIGKSTRSLTVCLGIGDIPVIDIAAVIINKDFEKHCVRKMKNDSGINRSAVVALKTVSQLRKRGKISCINEYLLGNDGAHAYNGNGTMFSRLRRPRRYNLFIDEACLQRIPSEKECAKIARKIGRDYELLGLTLDLRMAEIDHITLENPFLESRIVKILLKWINKNGSNATIARLADAFIKLGINPDIVYSLDAA